MKLSDQIPPESDWHRQALELEQQLADEQDAHDKWFELAQKWKGEQVLIRKERDELKQQLEAFKAISAAEMNWQLELRAANERLREVATCLLEWIDAVPADIELPTMPGVDRDWVNLVLAEGES